MLQSASNDGVHIDAVKIVLHDSGQDSLNAASTVQQEVAALGLTAKFAVASGFDGNGTAISHSKFGDLQTLLDHSASTNLGQDQGAHATADGGVNAQQPFEFAGLSHHVDHIA